jgi:hypothetical protein
MPFHGPRGTPMHESISLEQKGVDTVLQKSDCGVQKSVGVYWTSLRRIFEDYLT